MDEPRCRCGWPETPPFTVISEHPTPEGVTAYTRCVCGMLQVRPGGRGAPVVARGRPDA